MTEGLVLDVSVQGLEEMAASVDAYPQWLGREMTIAMDLGLHHLVGHVAGRTPVNQGTLRSSIEQSNISPWPNLVGRVHSPLPYAPVMEEGRKYGADATFPPIDAIKLWVIRKLQVPREEADSVAFLVARSIARHGFSRKGKVGPTGAKMFKEGLEAAEPEINRLFDKAVADSVARFNAS